MSAAATPALPDWSRLGVPLLAAVVALLPFGRLAELPLLAGAIAGFALALRHPRALAAEPRLPLLAALFLGYWLPELGSAPDAVAPRKAWTEVAADLRFLPFALFALAALPEARALRRLFALVAAILALWLLDAAAALLLGRGLGGPEAADRLSGIFGADDLKLGPTLAVLSPILIWTAGRRLGPVAALLALAATGAVVLLAGARAGWLVFALVALAWLRLAAPAGRRLAWAAALGAGALLGTLLAASLSERLAARLERSARLFTGETEAIDHALAGRLPIWRTALAVYVAHPVNGVGVRGFRHAYPEHAAAGDPWVGFAGDPALGAFHPHQLLLELAAETGTLGLLAWTLAAWAAIRGHRRSHPAVRAEAQPLTVALAVMLFPLNTHFAFYSSFWGLLLWWLAAVFGSALRRPPAPP